MLYSKILNIFNRNRNNRIAFIDNRIAFIGCSPRTGSTLLSRVLDSHSNIAVPCELMILKYFRNDIARGNNMAIDKHHQICDYYQAKIRKSKNQPEYLFGKILKKENKEFLIVKHPRHAIYFDEIIRDFPQAKYIHLVRDVRSVAMTTMFLEKPEFGFSRWYEYNHAIMIAFEQI